MAQITVAIINWNTHGETLDALRSIRKQRFEDFEVLLIDNGSAPENKRALQEGLKDVRKEAAFEIRYHDIKDNCGFSGAANIGLREAKSPFVLLLNNDVIIRDGLWLSELMEPMSDPRVAMTASKVIFYDGVNNDKIQFAGGRLCIFGVSHHDGFGEKDGPAFSKRKETFWAMGVSVLLRKSALDEMPEYICPHYFTYGEELDLCWRLRNNGYRIVFCPASVIYHKGSMSIKANKAMGKSDWYTMRNKYLTFWRNLPTWQAALVFPLVLGFDFARSLKRGGGFFSYYIGAIKAFAELYPKVRKYKNGSLRQLALW
ncbi:MAG: glycosyltransferase family 2 protein [Candidatus Aenigmatarchaeota archaeon]|nr:MAG: glycosyltransferase family 2 protein [Candidatus Aenigmarchaeota archaeon]